VVCEQTALWTSFKPSVLVALGYLERLQGRKLAKLLVRADESDRHEASSPENDGAATLANVGPFDTARRDSAGS
jgi:hypothetical protein